MRRCPRLEGDWTLLEGIFDLPHLRSEIQQLDDRSTQPEFWSDPPAANRALQRLSRLKGIAQPYDELVKTERDISELYDLLRDDPSPEVEKEADALAAEFLQKLDAYELRTLLSAEHDARNALFE